MLNALNSRFKTPSHFKSCTQKPRVYIALVGRRLGSPHQAPPGHRFAIRFQIRFPAMAGQWFGTVVVAVGVTEAENSAR